MAKKQVPADGGNQTPAVQPQQPRNCLESEFVKAFLRRLSKITARAKLRGTVSCHAGNNTTLGRRGYDV